MQGLDAGTLDDADAKEQLTSNLQTNKSIYSHHYCVQRREASKATLLLECGEVFLTRLISEGGGRGKQK